MDLGAIKWWAKERYALLTGRCFCGTWKNERADFITRHAWHHCCQGPGCNRCWRVEVGLTPKPNPWRGYRWHAGQ